MSEPFDKDKPLTDQPRSIRAGLHWIDNTINEHEAAGLPEYEYSLGFNREILEGKVVLDLGASSTEKLARDIKEAGINAKVISLSPDYKNQSVAGQLRFHQPEGERTGVAGIGQALPLKDASIDIILSEIALTYAASIYPEQIQMWVAEIGRVLKEGGQARVGPKYGDSSVYGEDHQDLVKWAKEAGLEVDYSKDYFVFTKNIIS